ncbi:hypothetical protein BV25DRAFT_1103660 [Artomyces pyxidatus]|uniref:Uncharacterized protein n=1 Tax=Artomyces pyxidatus TaxID=48021 RepID=A0ACB8TG56_9AGAM|nr:hypothetical protein BV25DRAFT_1103660 [Artomyces pyxidatus]
MQPPPHATPNPFTLQSATWNVPSVPTAATKATVAYVRAPDAHTEERSSPAGHPGTPVISSQEASVPPEASKPSLLSVSVDDDKDLDFDSLELVYPEDDSNDAPLPESDLVAQSGTISHGEASSSRDENPSIEEAPSVMELPDGWDSDLSDLTVLTDSGESEIDSEVEEELFPARTGLKIRIKIPPGFSFDTLGPSPSRVCHLKRCGRVLETGSRWKLCESCRAKFRQYQRARLNIQRPYKDKATAGNIVPGPNVDQNRSSLGERSKDSQSDVPRECSRRACRRLLPPVEQYRWKLCEKCHLRGHFGYKRRRAVGLLHPEVGQEAGVVRGGLAQHIIQMFNKQKAKREEHERGGVCGTS